MKGKHWRGRGAKNGNGISEPKDGQRMDMRMDASGESNGDSLPDTHEKPRPVRRIPSVVSRRMR